MSIIRFHTASDERPNDRTVTAHTSLDSSTEINIKDFAGGGVQVGTLSSATTLTYYVAAKPGGTYRQLYDRDNEAVTQAIGSDRSYPLPDEIYGFGALKLTADNEVLTIIVSLKG
jgi:hypothetical protein